MGLTRALAAQGMPVDLHLLYWVKTRAELCFLQELRALAARQPNFTLQVIVTHEDAVLPGDARGLISVDQLESLVPQLSQRQVYACGPGGFVAAARTCTNGRVRSFDAEGFTPAAPAVEAPASTVRVRLQRSGRELSISTGLSLLEALEQQGLNPPSGCRMGICHTCVCPRLDGLADPLRRDRHHLGAVPRGLARAVREVGEVAVWASKLDHKIGDVVGHAAKNMIDLRLRD